MYICKYSGAKGTLHLGVENSVDDCKRLALNHAEQNVRVRGYYNIIKAQDEGNGLISMDFKETYIGRKQGKSIVWT